MIIDKTIVTALRSKKQVLVARGRSKVQNSKWRCARALSGNTNGSLLLHVQWIVFFARSALLIGPNLLVLARLASIRLKQRAETFLRKYQVYIIFQR